MNATCLLMYIVAFYLGDVGFLAEDRRLNVAVTRARRHVAVVCDSQTVQSHAFLKSLISHMTEYGEVRTAFEYLHDIVPQNYTRNHKETKANTDANISLSTKQKVKDHNLGKEQRPIMPTGTKTKFDRAGSNKHAKSSIPPLSEEQAKGKYTEIREQIETFQNDLNRTELQFPSCLNSHDRLLVHQISEELGLRHESRGEGKDRCITVSRPLQSELTEKVVKEEPTEVAQKIVPEAQGGPSCQAPLDLKSLHLERMRREQQKREENAKQKKQQGNISIQTAQSSKKTKSAKGRIDHYWIYRTFLFYVVSM